MSEFTQKSHQELFDMVKKAEAQTLADTEREWVARSTELRSLAADLRTKAEGLRHCWSGTAANQFQTLASYLVERTGEVATKAESVASGAKSAFTALTTAKSEMPEPPPQWQVQAVQNGKSAGWASSPVTGLLTEPAGRDLEQRFEAERQRAVKVMETLDTGYQNAARAMAGLPPVEPGTGGTGPGANPARHGGNGTGPDGGAGFAGPGGPGAPGGQFPGGTGTGADLVGIGTGTLPAAGPGTTPGTGLPTGPLTPGTPGTGPGTPGLTPGVAPTLPPMSQAPSRSGSQNSTRATGPFPGLVPSGTINTSGGAAARSVVNSGTVPGARGLTSTTSEDGISGGRAAARQGAVAGTGAGPLPGGGYAAMAGGAGPGGASAGGQGIAGGRATARARAGANGQSAPFGTGPVGGGRDEEESRRPMRPDYLIEDEEPVRSATSTPVIDG